VFARYARQLEAIVEQGVTTNAYDIQKSSMAVARERMMRLLNANEINAIKDEAFQRGMLVEDIMNIFGVYLRDAVLAKKGIAVADADTPPAIPKAGTPAATP
jgi:hypothetical protein